MWVAFKSIDLHECPVSIWCRTHIFSQPVFFLLSSPLPPDDVEFEVSSDRRTGKPIAVKLLKIKPEVLPEERISGQVGPDSHASPFTVLHGYIHPVKEHHFTFGSVLVRVTSMLVFVGWVYVQAHCKSFH